MQRLLIWSLLIVHEGSYRKEVAEVADLISSDCTWRFISHSGCWCHILYAGVKNLVETWRFLWHRGCWFNLLYAGVHKLIVHEGSNDRGCWFDLYFAGVQKLIINEGLYGIEDADSISCSPVFKNWLYIKVHVAERMLIQSLVCQYSKPGCTWRFMSYI